MNYDKIRWDAWYNSMTGHGTSRDKTEYTSFSASVPLTDDQLDNLYCEGELVARICDGYPEQYFKKDFDIQIKINDEVDRVLSDEIKAELIELNIKRKLTDCFVWDNVFGGCGLYIGVDDSQDFSLPLDINRVDKLEYINVLDRRDLIPLSFYRDSVQGRYGEFELFNVASTNLVQSFFDTVHASRFLIFDGLRVSARKREKNVGWGQSFIQRCYGPLKSYGISWKSLDNILADGSQGVFKFKNYLNYIANNDFSRMQGRLIAMDMQRSTARSVVVDADQEDFQRQSFTWSGLDKPYQMIMLRLSAITGYPVSILMGREPAGLNATGDSDFRIFYDKCMSDQQNKVAPRIKELTKILCATRKKKPSSVNIKFEPLIEMSLQEKVDAYLKVAQADKIYCYDMDILTEEEISISRFSKDGWKLDTHINEEDRKRLQKAQMQTNEALESYSVEQNVSTDALNGAQMKSIVDIVGLIGAQEGGITENQAKGILKVAIPGISDRAVSEIVRR